RSFLALTKALLAIRREHPALHGGSQESVAGVPENCFAYVRTSAERRMLVALNFGGEALELALPGFGRGQVLVSTPLERQGPTELASFRLRGNEGCVILLD